MVNFVDASRYIMDDIHDLGGRAASARSTSRSDSTRPY